MTKITVKGVEVQGQDGSFGIDTIERFILDAGSDHLPTFGGKFEGGVQIQQVPDEIAPCIHAILDSGEPIVRYLEIGSAAGGSAFIINHYFKPKTIVLVDNNQHPKAHIRPYILRDIPHDEIIGNSHDEGTVGRIREMDMLFDVMMIDGDHFYEGVKADIENYAEFLRSGGLLIFHDSQIGKPYGCYQVFQELKTDSRWELIGEFVSSKYQPCGIGLFRKAGDE